ncbi:MAG: rRNA pseudouridine synthase [Luteimonas sp.]|nr:rRNA pseudouridine synthase [Luteimonas sp.]
MKPIPVGFLAIANDYDGSVPAPERLQKLLATAGLGSRRTVEDWIRAGRIAVNGVVATLGGRATATDTITLDGRPVPLSPRSPAREVLIYHKPLGEVTTRHDPQGRPTVFERLPAPAAGRWIVVGRLDVNTTGLLLFTTDGELAHHLMHPSGEVEREYLVRVRGEPDAATLRRLTEGVRLEDGYGRFDRIEPQSEGGSHDWFRVVLREGRNREVRRLWMAVDCDVSRLMRLRYGPVSLPQDLRPGAARRLGREAVDALVAATTTTGSRR